MLSVGGGQKLRNIAQEESLLERSRLFKEFLGEDVSYAVELSQFRK